jgi:hypothetical protein
MHAAPAQERYGRPFSRTVDMVGLWWYSAPLNIGKDPTARVTGTDALAALGSPGVYAFEGKHDSRPEGGLLYIGRVGKRSYRDADGSDPSRTLRHRITESAGRFAWYDGSATGLYADVWDVTIRFAIIGPEDVARVESLLIRAHTPSFNAQQVRSPVNDESITTVVLMNAGEKGRLLPAVAGAYYERPLWTRMGGG